MTPALRGSGRPLAYVSTCRTRSGMPTLRIASCAIHRDQPRQCGRPPMRMRRHPARERSTAKPISCSSAWRPGRPASLQHEIGYVARETARAGRQYASPGSWCHREQLIRFRLQDAAQEPAVERRGRCDRLSCLDRTTRRGARPARHRRQRGRACVLVMFH
jgi:hypothetical protein